MLSVTGIIDGRNRQDEKMSHEQFIETFGIKVPKSRIIDMRYTKVPAPGRQSYGSPAVGKEKTLLCEFTGVFKGNNIKVRYYETFIDSPIPKTGGVITKFFPRKIAFGHQKKFRFDENPELCAFILATPQGRGTPVSNGNVRQIFYVDMPEERAMKNNESKRRFASIINEVSGTEEHRLRVIAQGLKVGKRTVSYFPEIGTEELREMIFDLASLDQSGFIEAWEDKRTIMRGNIRELLDSGLIVMEQSGATKIARWSNQVGGAEICRWSSDLPIVDAIMGHNMVPANHDSFIRQMDAVTGKVESDQLSSTGEYAQMVEDITTKGGRISQALMNKSKVSVDDLGPLELLRFAFDSERLFKDMRTRQVFYMRGGDVTEDVFFSANGKNLTKELEHYAASEEGFGKLKDIFK